MKKVLIVATYFPPSGGVGVFRIAKFAKYLKRLNYEPTVITIDDKSISNYDYSLTKDIENIKIYKLSLNDKKDSVEKSFTKKLRLEIFKIINIENPDILLFTGGPFLPLTVARLAHDKTNIPYIIDLRDPWTLQTFPKSSGIKKIIYKIARLKENIRERYVFKKAKYILVINNIIKENYIKKYPVYKNKIKIIHNGFDLEDYNNIKTIKNKEFTICYAGKYTQALGDRNPSSLFKVISMLNNSGYNVKYLSIGIREDKIMKLAIDNNCSNYCQFVGFKPFAETIELEKNSDLNIIFATNKKIEQTGKIFDLINLKKPVILLSDIESDLVKICRTCNFIKIFKYSEIDKIYDYIKKIYLKEINYDYNIPVELEKYNRIKLTKELIKLIEK